MGATAVVQLTEGNRGEFKNDGGAPTMVVMFQFILSIPAVWLFRQMVVAPCLRLMGKINLAEGCPKSLRYHHNHHHRQRAPPPLLPDLLCF